MRLAFSILALSATAAAQLTVIPSAVATVRPTFSPFYIANTFYSTAATSTTPAASHSQQIVDCADIAAPGAVWTSLEVRRPVGLGNSNPALITNATIIMSVSPMPWQSATTTFATNHGPTPVTVLSGSISLPAAINQATWPAPWQPPFPFTVPFPYGSIAGGSLVIDIHQDQGATHAGTPWYIEFTTPNVGGRAENGGPQSTCTFSTAPGSYNNGISYSLAGLAGTGGTWFVSYNASPGGLPVNAIGIGAIGANGHGGSWSGVPLSIDLGPLGAPGCRWSTSMEIVVGLVATGTAPATARWPNITIPADPALRGSAFYDHALFIDPAANAAGFVTTWSSKWNIGTGIGAPGAYLSATGTANLNPTGSLVRGGAISLQLQ